MSRVAASQAAPAPYLDRPRLLAVSGVALASAAAWVALAMIEDAASLAGIDWFAALCRAAALPVSAWPTAVAMWLLMSIAMMLPTAAPAIDIHVRLTRRIEAHRAAHVAGFAGGYLAAWAGFALIAASGQVLAGAWAGGFPWPQGVIAGGLLILAGLYQLTPLKQACLTLCRNPMAFFLSHWREGVGGSLRMGLHHGVICIGCCWALMALMFLAGMMNLVWMAALGLAMLIEKTVPGAAQAGRLTGLAMALAGAALITAEII